MSLAGLRTRAGVTADELLRRSRIAIEDADEAWTRAAEVPHRCDEKHRRRLKLFPTGGAIDHAH